LFCEIILKSYVPDGLTDFVDQLNKPLLMKKSDELHSSSTNNYSESSIASSISSLRRNRMLTDTASAPNPSTDTKITTTGASSISINTITTTDGTSSASSSSVKYKTPTEIIILITLEYLREQKTFLKLQQKQDKESILMKKKHAKEQSTLGEQQSKIMNKAKNDLEKLTRSPMIHIANQRKDVRYEKQISFSKNTFHSHHF
jgi:hypothetical protein